MTDLPTFFDLTIHRGDDEPLTLTVVRPDEDNIDQPVDLTGVTIWFTAKNAWSDADADAVIALTTPTEIAITDAPGGIARINVTADNTKNLTAYTRLVYDVQMLEGGAGGPTTLVQGKLTVSRDVTRAVTP